MLLLSLPLLAVLPAVIASAVLSPRAIEITYTCPGRSPSHPHIMCGANGKVTHPANMARTFATSANMCAAACMSTKGCKSISYARIRRNGRGSCKLYSKDVENQGFVTERGGDSFYNVHCFDCLAKPSGSSSATSTTTSSSSSTSMSSSSPSPPPPPPSSSSPAPCSTITSFAAGALNAAPTSLATFCDGTTPVFQTDENFVVYAGDGGPGYQSNTWDGGSDCTQFDCQIQFTNDGALQIVDSYYPKWIVGGNAPGATLTLQQTQPYIIIKDASGNEVWSSGG